MAANSVPATAHLQTLRSYPLLCNRRLVACAVHGGQQHSIPVAAGKAEHGEVLSEAWPLDKVGGMAPILRGAIAV
jgi:hypothetical protein